MTDESASSGGPAVGATSAPSLPAAVDRADFEAELDRLRIREKAHTREGDAVAAARRHLPIVEVDASLALTGPHGPLTLLDAFEGRRQLIRRRLSRHPAGPAKRPGRMHLVCYLRDGQKVFETYWTTLRGVETMDYCYAHCLWAPGIVGGLAPRLAATVLLPPHGRGPARLATGVRVARWTADCPVAAPASWAL